MELTSTIVTLFLVMDPLGNIPLFLSMLDGVPAERRRRVLVREIVLAFLVLIVFLLAGDSLLRFLGLDQEAVGIAGGIVLFLIALRMIFPRRGGQAPALPAGEPFLVPLAVPLIAGPSTLATLLLLQRTAESSLPLLLLALTLAWAVSGTILFASTWLYRLLGERGLIALERLMGMVLVMVAVQMLLDGIGEFLRRL